MLKLRPLMAFHALMLTGTVTGAARRLGLSQPAISALVANLEQTLGVKLFIRENNRLIPTEEARYFKESVGAVLDRLAGIEQLATDLRGANVGALRIAALPMLSLRFLPRVTAEFLETHPDVHITLQARSSPTVSNLVAAQQFDLGFSETPHHPSWVDAEPFSLRCVCLVHRTHPLAGKAAISPSDLDGVPLAAAPADHPRTRKLLSLMEEAGATANLKIETPLFASMCAFVAAGSAVAVVDPITAADCGGPDTVALPFDPPLHADFSILFPRGRSRSLVTEQFLLLVRHRLREFTADASAKAPSQA